MSNPKISSTEARGSWVASALAVLLLTLITVYAQEQSLGIHFIESVQMVRHEAVMTGTSANPWSYRVLSEYVAEAFIRMAAVVTPKHAELVGLLSLRLLQNACLFVLALLFYRRLGLTARESFIGIVVPAYSITHALYNSDLSFNTYSDICFYLFSGWIVLKYGASWWLLPISFLAALNRETSLFISLMPLAQLVAVAGRGWLERAS